MVVTVTINPAMDKILAVDKFCQNITNRIQRQFDCVGGKGTHISMNLSLMGIRNRAVGVVMGQTGDEILHALESMNIEVRFLRLDQGNSRTNYVLVDKEGNCTLISEKGQLMEQAVVERLISHYSGLVESGDIVVISGDASNQRDTTLQERLIDIAVAQHARFCLDASGEHLAAGVRKKPFLIKPNLDELGSLCGRNLVTEDDIIFALRQVQEFGIENIIASCGSSGSYALSSGKLFHIFSPEVEVKNTVGCGDALLAGILAGLEMGLPMEKNLRQATAIAAATAMHEATVGFDPAAAAKLEEKVEVLELPFQNSRNS